MTDEEIAREWFTQPLLHPGAIVASGAIRVHGDKLDDLIASIDTALDGSGCMVVARGDVLGRLVIDEIVTAERTD